MSIVKYNQQGQKPGQPSKTFGQPKSMQVPASKSQGSSSSSSSSSSAQKPASKSPSSSNKY